METFKISRIWSPLSVKSSYKTPWCGILEAKIKELPSIFLEEDGTTTEMTAAFYSLNREKGRFIELPMALYLLPPRTCFRLYCWR